MKRISLVLIATALAAAPAYAGQSAPEAPPATRFSVEVEGKGPDVILIPGLISSRAVWDGAVTGLGGKYRVHRMQIAGFAGEPAGANASGEILPGVVEQLHLYILARHLHHPRIVGHSLGGLLALMLAAAHPDDVGPVLVVDALPFYGMLFGPDATSAAVEPRAAAFRDAMKDMSDEAYRAQQPQTLASLVKNEAARAKVLEWSLASDRKVAAEAVYEDIVTDMRPKLADIAAPLTVAYAVNEYATRDKVEPLYKGGYAAARDVRFVPVEGAYHFLMLDQPDRFQVVLADFLAGRR
jgi:pimeloyl-ACP methyl ester carboxylesterase